LAAASLPGASAFADAPISAGRSILPITRDWRFHPAKVDGAQSPYFND
jgi:beta-galactosidase